MEDSAHCIEIWANGRDLPGTPYLHMIKSSLFRHVLIVNVTIWDFGSLQNLVTI